MRLRLFLDAAAVAPRHAPGEVPTPEDHRPPNPHRPPSPPRCAHCGDVIGVYERLVEVIGGIARETSRAAEPHLASSPGTPWYHGPCYLVAEVR